MFGKRWWKDGGGGGGKLEGLGTFCAHDHNRRLAKIPTIKKHHHQKKKKKKKKAHTQKKSNKTFHRIINKNIQTF